MTAVTSSSWDVVNAALARGDAKAAAVAAQDGLRAAAYEERKRFCMQLCAVLLQRARTRDGAPSVAEAGEALWAMPEFRGSPTGVSSVTGEALLLAVSIAAAYTTMHEEAKALQFDREILQSPMFFTYDGLNPVERLACVARVLAASRVTGERRYVESAVHRGMSLYYGFTKASPSPAGGAAAAVTEENEDATTTDASGGRSVRESVACAYLYEVALYRQEQKDYLRASQSFFALCDAQKSNGHGKEALTRAALCALCIRAAVEVRQAALHEVLQRSTEAALPSLYRYLQLAQRQQLFRATDTSAVLAVASTYVPSVDLRDAIREHNIALLAQTFECVYWRSLCVHMDDEDITEVELYDLLVTMGRAQRLCVAIHQDTGYIEFDDGACGAVAKHRTITDADVFSRVADVAAGIAAARPSLLA